MPLNPQSQVAFPQPTPHGGSLPTGAEHQPVPYHVSSPWGEAPIYDEPRPETVPQLQGTSPAAAEDYIHQRMNLAFGYHAIDLDWQNDDQYGYPPPGAPNVQPFQSGHTSIVVHNPSSEQGWGTDPAFAWPRYPHMENKFPGYNRNGVFRRNGQWTAQILLTERQTRMQYIRDLQARRATNHSPHGVIVADPPSVTHTANTPPLDATAYTPVHIGPEGVLPG